MGGAGRRTCLALAAVTTMAVNSSIVRLLAASVSKSLLIWLETSSWILKITAGAIQRRGAFWDFPVSPPRGVPLA